MRYIGNKKRILTHIDEIIKSFNLKNGTFLDLFSGSGTVSDYFKDKYKIISNDYLTYASIFSEAKIRNEITPAFEYFTILKGSDPFTYWNQYDYSKEKPGFITKEYSPKGGRMFFQEKNSIKIDTIRRQIDEYFEQGIFTKDEKVFLIASLLESVMTVSNTSGTYEAFFRDWERRSNNLMVYKPLELSGKSVYDKGNISYSRDANTLVNEVSGDIAYIDPPYTTTQYASAYHLLETIAKFDEPEIKGKTGRRQDRVMSLYSKRNEVKTAFEDLLRKINFEYIIISYSNQSLMEIDELIELSKCFAVNSEVYIKNITYREYRNLNSSKKGNGKPLEEYLIYFKKNVKINKSPINYSGSKSWIMDKLIKELPSNLDYFVDCMGGAFNVGANIYALKGVVYNEKNPQVYEMVKLFLERDSSELLEELKEIIHKYNLKPKGKEKYIELRNEYNSYEIEERNPLHLYVLSLYSFQHMLRFNSKGMFNVPIGNSGINSEIEKRVMEFEVKSKLIGITNLSYEELKPNQFNENTLFYFDPPYIITSAAYNDGKRLDSEWTIENEIRLLSYLESLDRSGYKFMLSNVLEHNNKRNELLFDWINKNKYRTIYIGSAGRRYKRKEILVVNY